MTETFYDLLGVSDDATGEEIESAYREAVKRVHPDVSDDVDAGERTKRLNKAKRVLTDEDERARYDRLGHETYTGDGSSSAGTNSTDPTNRENAADSERTSKSDGSGTDGTGSSGAHWGGSSDTATDGHWRGSSGDGESARSDGSGESSHSGGSGRSAGESTWRGSQQRGRRSGRRREAHRRDRRPGGGFDVGAAAGNGSGGSDTDAAGADTGAAGPSRSGRTRSSGSGRNRSPGDGTTRSRGDSTGPTWQSGTATASGGAGSGVTGSSPSAQRQAAAGSTDGPNVDWSWNAWGASGAWAVRQSADGARRLRPSRLFPKGQSLVILGSIFFLYPFFVGSMLYPPFPLAARLTIAACTLLTFAYLLSIPEAAIVIYGLWSVLVPLALLAAPGVTLFSLFGVIGLTATWLPLGLSVLTFSLVRP